MKNAFKILYIFAVIGLGMLIGAGYTLVSTYKFLGEANAAEGVVINLLPVQSNDSTTYKPVVRFVDSAGKEIEFSSSTSSNPPSYRIGEKVEVLYRAADSRDAKINGYFSLWGGSIILGVLGTVFFLVGLSPLITKTLKNRKETYLKVQGTAIETEFQSVQLNESLSVNGKHPFRIFTQWQHPSTREIHVFTSSNLWFDPSNYVKDQPIRVYIAPNNPKKYFVDLSFLPKLAE